MVIRLCADDGRPPMMRLPASNPFAADDRYRERATRRRVGTNVAMAAMIGLAAVIAGVMVYVIILVVTMLANMLGQQATGRIEQRYRSGAEAAVAAVVLVLPGR
jgi:hypothetical protein